MKSIEYKNHYINISDIDCDGSCDPRSWDNLGTMYCYHKRYNLGDDQKTSIIDLFLHLATDKQIKKLALQKAKENNDLKNYLLKEYKDYSGYLNEYYNDSSFSSKRDFRESMYLLNEIGYYLPIYIYDHSGITINTTGFSCNWDSGLLGFIFVSKDKLKKEGLNKKRSKTILEYLDNEVKIYNQFLTGDIFRYEITDSDENFIDSCNGFFGYEEALKEAKNVVDHYGNNFD